MTKIPDLDVLVSSLGKVIGTTEVDPNRPMAELNVDSLGLLEWLHVLEDDHGFKVSDELVSMVDSGMSVAEVYERFTASVRGGSK